MGGRWLYADRVAVDYCVTFLMNGGCHCKRLYLYLNQQILNLATLTDLAGGRVADVLHQAAVPLERPLADLADKVLSLVKVLPVLLLAVDVLALVSLWRPPRRRKHGRPHVPDAALSVELPAVLDLIRDTDCFIR